jgi:cytochrome c553
MAMIRWGFSVLGLVVFSLSWATLQAGWASEARGHALFRLCAACHSDRGEGRADLGAPAIAGLPAWYVQAQLLKFREGVRGAHPQDLAGMRMRPMARTLRGGDDVAAVASYVAGLPPQPPPPTLAGDVARGAAQYAVCMACHGPNGRGNEALQAPPLVLSNDWYLLRQLQNFVAGVRAGDPARDATGAMMRPIASGLDESSMRDVIAYIQTLR